MCLRYVLPVLLSTLAFQPSAASAAETLWTEVHVRVYDATGVRASERERSLKVASSIVSGTSVGIVWTFCGPRASAGAATPPAACESPMEPGELVVRIVRSQEPGVGAGRLPLGDAFIDRRAGAGVLATVYVDRVAWMAEQTGVDPQVLLGRAIAHELGHLLLATSVHGSGGLMRAVWSLTELRRTRMSDWAFRPSEVAAISARVHAR